MVKKRMNYLLISMILLLIGCPFIASLWAEEPPLFQFKPGSNTLILQIVNSSRFELLSLKVSIDKPKDTNWLRLEDEAQVSRVPAQNQCQPLEVGLNFVVEEGCTEKLVASGTYFYVLESGDFVQVKKLTLVR